MGIAVLLVILGAVYNLVFIVFAAPFGVAAYFMWYHATGRLTARVRARSARQRRGTTRGNATNRGRRTRSSTGGHHVESRREASRILGVDTDAEAETIRRAYRERVKEAHPDTDGGSMAEFKRVTDAYDRLRKP